MNLLALKVLIPLLTAIALMLSVIAVLVLREDSKAYDLYEQTHKVQLERKSDTFTPSKKKNYLIP